MIFRMYKECDRVYQDSWRNISRKSLWASSPTISLNGVIRLICGCLWNIASFLCQFIDTMILLWFCVFFSLENESEGLKTSKLSYLSAQLDKEKRRAESLKEFSRENAFLLQRQTQLYLSVSTPINVQMKIFYNIVIMNVFVFLTRS